MGRNTASLYAEYRDEVDKYNKKQEVLLQRHLRVIRRQERVTQGVIKKCRQEVRQIKVDIKNTESHSMDLSDYDALKEFQRIVGGNGFRTDPNYSPPQVTPRNGAGVKLPPLWQRSDSETMESKQGINSRYLGTGRPKALSLRALRSKKKLLEPIETAINSHRQSSEPQSKVMGNEEGPLEEDKEVENVDIQVSHPADNE